MSDLLEKPDAVNLEEAVLTFLDHKNQTDNLAYVTRFDCVQDAIAKVMAGWRKVPLRAGLKSEMNDLIGTQPAVQIFDGRTWKVAEGATPQEVTADRNELQAWLGAVQEREIPDLIGGFNSDLVQRFFLALFEKKLAYHLFYVDRPPYREPKALDLMTGGFSTTDARIERKGYILVGEDTLQEVVVEGDRVRSLLATLFTFPKEDPILSRKDELDAIVSIANSTLEILNDWLTEQENLQMEARAMRVNL
jgi:hypothetical protein